MSRALRRWLAIVSSSAPFGVALGAEGVRASPAITPQAPASESAAAMFTTLALFAVPLALGLLGASRMTRRLVARRGRALAVVAVFAGATLSSIMLPWLAGLTGIPEPDAFALGVGLGLGVFVGGGRSILLPH